MRTKPRSPKKRNWVNEALNAATRRVQAWPEWMRRPEVRMVPVRMAPVEAKPSTEPTTSNPKMFVNRYGKD